MGFRGPSSQRAKPIKLGKRTPATWEQPGLTRAQRVIAFVESLTITSGLHAGRKFLLRPWQKEIVTAWYATDAAGHRVVRTGLLSLARKNGKTSLCAALALAHLLGPERERRGQVVACAKDRDQASLIYDELVAFIYDNPEYLARTNIQRHAKTIEDLPTGSKFRTMTSDAAKAHGMSPSVVIVDELAQWGSTPTGREVFTAVTTAMGARAEPLTLIISTQSPDAHSLMTEFVEYGKEINAGRIVNPTFSAHLFEVPMDVDPWDETLWPLANPALGDFRSLEEMREFASRAQRMPALAAMFKAYYLNQPIRTEMRWLDQQEWDACPALAWPLAAGRKCYAGLDLASKRDLTALALWFPQDDGTWGLHIEAWCPADTIAERAQTDQVPYQQWVADGWLHATPGSSTDYAFIEKRIYELAKDYELVELGVDPWNARDLATRLAQNSVKLVEIPQTLAQLTTPAKEFERLILTHQVAHAHSPLVRWCVGNAVARIDANENIRPDKDKSRDKIDPVSAAITGLARALVLAAQGMSIYERVGAIVL